MTMTKYSDIEIETAKNLLKEGYKWIARNGSGRLFAYYEKPIKADTCWYSIWYPIENSGYVCKELVPIFQGIRFDDKEPTSLERIVYQQILDDVERRYLRAVIRPFRKRVKHISKEEAFDCSEEFIHIELSDGDISDFPNFKANTMYKGMKLGRKYTLDELGI